MKKKPLSIKQTAKLLGAKVINIGKVDFSLAGIARLVQFYKNRMRK